MARDIVIGMAGSGGDGIVSAGESLLSAAAREGFHAMMTKSFGPQIRGGESSCRVRLSERPLSNPGAVLDVAVALNWDDFLRFGAELPCGPGTVVVYESKTGVAPDALPLTGVTPAQVFSLPLGDMTKSAAGTDKAKNSLVLGLLSGWLGVGREGVPQGIRARFGKKGDDVVQQNLKAFGAGLSYAEANPLTTPRTMSAPGAVTQKLLADGNDVAAAAAIFAGCRFFSGYPITPSSEVMQFLGREIWKYGGALLQCEDEIAGIGAALGASLAGKKAMTATSGPGMDLKTEIMGLASIAELPLVILNVQRGGPSTGLPTKAEQSDLFQACFSAHGDVLRPVLAPTSVPDTFGVVVEAFNIAEKYQTPVIVLSDQEIGHRKETFDPIDTSRFVIEERLTPTAEELAKGGYERYAMTESRVSPITHPGMRGGAYLGAGIEHNESGAPASGGSMHARMNAKRFDKLAPLKAREDLVTIEGDLDAPLALLGWGSVGGVCREAMEIARADGMKVKLIVPKLLYPVPEAIYDRFFASVRGGVVVEQSHQGQFYRLLRMFVDVPKGVQSFARGGANPFSSTEVVRRLRTLAEAKEQSAT